MHAQHVVHIAWMQQALLEAEQAKKQGEIPVGAVLVQGDLLIARGHNACITTQDPTAHAEIQVLRAAGQHYANYRFPSACVLYVTLEPCPMCTFALQAARVDKIVYAASDPKQGACGSHLALHQDPTMHHRLEVVAEVLGDEARKLLLTFFQERRT